MKKFFLFSLLMVLFGLSQNLFSQIVIPDWRVQEIIQENQDLNYYENGIVDPDCVCPGDIVSFRFNFLFEHGDNQFDVVKYGLPAVLGLHPRMNNDAPFYNDVPYYFPEGNHSIPATEVKHGGYPREDEYFSDENTITVKFPWYFWLLLLIMLSIQLLLLYRRVQDDEPEEDHTEKDQIQEDLPVPVLLAREYIQILSHFLEKKEINSVRFLYSKFEDGGERLEMSAGKTPEKKK